MGTRQGTWRTVTVGTPAALVFAVVGALTFAPSMAVACDPPSIVDEETGELDQEAWDAGVEECARWVDEMEGDRAARVAAIVAGGIGVAVGAAMVWLARRRAARRRAARRRAARGRAGRRRG